MPRLSRLRCLSHLIFASVFALVIASVISVGVHADYCPANAGTLPTTDAVMDDAPLAVRGCDLNGDGALDLVTANDGSDTVSVLINDGGGSYAPFQQWSVDNDAETLSEPVELVCCDVDGDTVTDIVTVNHTTDDVSVLFNTGGAQFAAPVKYAVGEAPFGVACLNLDGDSDNDLVTVGFTEDAITVLLNQGDGTFAPQATYSTGDAPIAMDLCDLDGDG
ncbi:MAG: FG-GAP repeat domain-containing protein, partial [Planctomycetota bacterium]